MGNFSLDTGGINTFIVVLDPVIQTVYASNFVGRFKATNTNTGPCTINAGAGPIPLVNDQGTILIAGDIQAGMIVT
jgi:hypothetical protein